MKPVPMKSRFKRWSDRFAVGAALVVVAYALVLTFPQPAFPHQFEGEFVRLYAAESIDPTTARPVLEGAERRILASGLADPTRRYDVFLTSSASQFAFFANRSHGSFAVSYSALGTTFIRPPDLGANEVRTRRAEHSRRTLSSVIAHEVMHHAIRDELGFIRTFLLPQWTVEGVAEFVAGESSFDPERGVELMRSGGSHPSLAFRYFRARALVAYLINRRGMTLADVLRSDLDSDRVEVELRNHLAGSQHDSEPAILLPPDRDS